MVVEQLLAAADLYCEKSSREGNPERLLFWCSGFWV